MADEEYRLVVFRKLRWWELVLPRKWQRRVGAWRWRRFEQADPLSARLVIENLATAITNDLERWQRDEK